MRYAVDLVATSRGAGNKPLKGLSSTVRLGASPRASIALIRSGQANALLAGRDYVIPEDVKMMVHEVLRHRVILTFGSWKRFTSHDRWLTPLTLLIFRRPDPQEDRGVGQFAEPSDRSQGAGRPGGRARLEPAWRQ